MSMTRESYKISADQAQASNGTGPAPPQGSNPGEATKDPTPGEAARDSDGDDSVFPDSALGSTNSVAEPYIHRTGTVVSFVLGEEQEDDAEESKKNMKRKIKKDNGHSRSISLSKLYAIILVLVGVAFPVTEALKSSWMSTHVVSMFLVYNFVVASVFLIYLQYELSVAKKHHDKLMESERRGGTLQQQQQQPTAGNANGRVTSQQGDVLLVRRKISTISDAGLTSRPSFSSISQVGLQDAGSGSILPGDSMSRTLRPSLGSIPEDGESGTQAGGISIDMGSEADEGDDVFDYINVHSQTATVGHEGTSFYLRLGCLLFSIANLIYVGLEIEHYIGENLDCPSRPDIYHAYFHLLFIGVQTFFLFKVNKIHIKRRKVLARFGLMHTLACNLCVWLRILVFEVYEAVAHSEDGEPHDVNSDLYFVPIEETNSTDALCRSDTLLMKVSPYLFPFVLEYSLIAVATMASMFASLNVRVTRDLLNSVKKMAHRARRHGHHLLEEVTPHHTEHDDGFGKSHRGLFAGMVVLAGTLISIILFFFYLSEGKEYEAMLTNGICDISLMTILLLAVSIGMLRLFDLGFTLTRDNSIDHVLLVFSMSGLFLLELFEILAPFVTLTSDTEMDKYEHVDLIVLDGVTAIFAALQGVLQTVFIVDGMQRFPTNAKQIEQKPGRGTITFLILGNLSVWLFRTFQEKDTNMILESDFYGSTAWPIIFNINLPLLLFFRFHSSICLADMWVAAYEPVEGTDIFESKYVN